MNDPDKNFTALQYVLIWVLFSFGCFFIVAGVYSFIVWDIGWTLTWVGRFWMAFWLVFWGLLVFFASRN